MDFSKLDKKTLMEGVRHWVKQERRATLSVLDYLAEIDRRQFWLEDGYSSLHDFCVRFLGYSEGEAASSKDRLLLTYLALNAAADAFRPTVFLEDGGGWGAPARVTGSLRRLPFAS